VAADCELRTVDWFYEIEDELADVLFFIIRFAQRYDIDLAKAAKRKLKKSGRKYPVSKSKGSNKKYTDL
jgi:NTP pyrophosphatase (non-canonical NTP hydrolase)